MIQDRTTRSKAISIHTEARRKKVAEMLNIGLSEAEIARQLGKSRTTINQDVIAMKALATDFVYQLARSDICYFYKNTIDSLVNVKAEAMRILKNNEGKPTVQLKALDVIVRADLAAFDVLSQGPLILSVKTLNERVEKIESGTGRNSNVIEIQNTTV